MKTKKTIVITISLILIITGYTLILSEFCNFKTIYFLKGHDAFIRSFMLSIFTSSFILLIITVIEYNIERKLALEVFYVESLRLAEMYKQIKPLGYESSNEEFYDLVTKYIDIYHEGIKQVGDLYSKLDFMFGNFRFRNWIYNNIYIKFCRIYDLLEILNFHYIVGGADRRILEYYVVDIQKQIFKGEFKNIRKNVYYHNIYNTFYDKIMQNLDTLFIKTYGSRINRHERKPTISILRTFG